MMQRIIDYICVFLINAVIVVGVWFQVVRLERKALQEQIIFLQEVSNGQ